MRSFWTIIVGTLLLMAGIVWFLIATGAVDGIGFLATWWPMFIIVPFAIRLFFCPGKLISINFVAIGVILMLYTLGFIEHLWQVLSIAAPIAVIFVAMHLLFGRKGPHGHGMTGNRRR